MASESHLYPVLQASQPRKLRPMPFDSWYGDIALDLPERFRRSSLIRSPTSMYFKAIQQRAQGRLNRRSTNLLWHQ